MEPHNASFSDSRTIPDRRLALGRGHGRPLLGTALFLSLRLYLSIITIFIPQKPGPGHDEGPLYDGSLMMFLIFAGLMTFGCLLTYIVNYAKSDPRSVPPPSIDDRRAQP